MITTNRPDDIHQITTLDVDQLLLDKDNPRLAALTRSTDQFDLLKVLWTEMAVDELVISIAANGFFPEEPLFVIPENRNRAGAGGERFIVVEGNRRLAAVRILLDDTLRTRLRATSLPTIDEEKKTKLRNLPVSIYQTRRVLWAYLSFRHINSPKSWDSFAKAKYIAQVHNEYNVSIQEIAKRIGDRHDTVERIYRGYQVLEQAERETRFTIEDRTQNRFYFSHLYTAIDYPEFQAFLGIDSDTFSGINPVPKDHLSNLSEVMFWIYGSKSEKKAPIVQKQNPDLTRLRQVIDNPTALDALRSGYPLEQAFNVSQGDELLFRNAVYTAVDNLKRANATVSTGYQGDDNLYKIMEDIDEIRKTVLREMRRIRSKSTSRGAR